jgi:hypothetical protein
MSQRKFQIASDAVVFPESTNFETFLKRRHHRRHYPTSGTALGESCEGWFRLALVPSPEKLATALKKWEQWIQAETHQF